MAHRHGHGGKRGGGHDRDVRGHHHQDQPGPQPLCVAGPRRGEPPWQVGRIELHRSEIDGLRTGRTRDGEPAADLTGFQADDAFRTEHLDHGGRTRLLLATGDVVLNQRHRGKGATGRRVGGVVRLAVGGIDVGVGGGRRGLRPRREVQHTHASSHCSTTLDLAPWALSRRATSIADTWVSNRSEDASGTRPTTAASGTTATGVSASTLTVACTGHAMSSALAKLGTSGATSRLRSALRCAASRTPRCSSGRSRFRTGGDDDGLPVQVGAAGRRGGNPTGRDGAAARLLAE